MIGERIGEYELTDVVGEGGMATVYRAYQPSFDRFVALKLLPRDISDDPKALKRFQQEARTIARLEHRSILPVYAYGEHEGMPYIVTRLLEGGSLQRRLFYQGVELDAAARIVGQVAEALDYAHAQGVIHRDLKPSNVLLDEQGNAYLTDFGIAQMLDAAPVEAGAGVAGTPSYMSPEQCQGKPATPASDVYALGVLIYELVTGRPPFEADTPLEIMVKQVKDPAPSVREYDSTLPAALDRVLQRALAKNPAARYASAGALAAAFRTVVEAMAGQEAYPPPVGPVAGVPAVAGPATLPSAAAPVAPTARSARRPEKRRIAPGLVNVVLGLAIVGTAVAAGILVMKSLQAGAAERLPTTQFPGGAPGVSFSTATQAPAATAGLVEPLPTATEAQPTATITALAEGDITNTPPIATLAQTPGMAPLPEGPGRLAYTRGSGGSAEVMVIDDNGQNGRALTSNSTYDGEPDWSPDGNRIAFESERTGQRQIFVMNADGSAVEQLTEGSAPASHPDWSPDGATIVYERGTGASSEIYAIPAEGGEPVQLTDDNTGDRAPQFSPDGTRIAFMTERRGPWEIAVMSYPEGELEVIYECPAPDCRFPVWAPDGGSIVYNTLDGTGRVDEVWVVDTATGQSVPLITEGQNGRPTWSGSGQMIFFNRTEGQNTGLYAFMMATRETVQLTTQAANEYGPDWTPR